ncbi:MAG: bifunctional UDP-N-acetylmuramoyl-tripeptide:D-alanyl-D-alanine ligase/alanine racemase [Carboxylicivirga sp.]|jgi:alanine racemase|nr:bifunctional UDP-N-acetylmuramoyl-tripeptide:D-alanyl-D-alanine ligase/alanine racemase [Carboxylicivirga sp.]
MGYSVSQLAQMASARVIGKGNIGVDKIVYDSRKTFMPDQTLFVAIQTTNNDGHNYITDLYYKGIRAFIVEERASIDYNSFPDAGFIVCKDSIQCLQAIAEQIRRNYQIPFIGITGSNGKTIVKEWLSKVLDCKYKLGRSPRSFNSQIGVPLSIWMLDKDIDCAVIEAGISKPDEMENLVRCIHPEIGILTNIGQAHQENFESVEQKLREKLQLFKESNTILFDGDDKLITQTIQEIYPNRKLKSCGRNADNDLQLCEQEFHANGSKLTLKWESKVFDVHFAYQDRISIDNLLLVILAALVNDIEIDQLQGQVDSLQPIAMRLEQKEGVNNCLLIDDAYNADLTSLELALDFLNQMGARRDLSKTLILSDIYQSGIDANALFSKIRRLCKEKGVSKLIGIGKHLYAAMEGINAYRDTDDFLRNADLNEFKDEAILLKGSRNFAFERISAHLEQRRHKTVLEINLNALTENVQWFRSKLKKNTRLLAMVKAFSYGTGSFEIANLLQHQKVDYLGVAFADEGIELRKAGITLPIIVMNPELSSFPLMLEYELEPEIYSFEVLNAFRKAVQRQGMTNVPIHIKVDTGMNRLGFLIDELDDLLDQLKSSGQLKVSSVFSHLAGSDEAIHDGFTEEQIHAFKSACSKLKLGLGYDFIKHILNSAGIERFPNAQFDMVRLGIGMYGVSATGQNLAQVNCLKSYVSQIKVVKAGATVGYSRKGQSENETRIAVIPIGYADGFNRQLSNGVGQVSIRGQRAKIIGNICMDMCMADVSDLKIKEGDEVEIFGSVITLHEVASTLNTIPYEILTSISRRVKRVYVME